MGDGSKRESVKEREGRETGGYRWREHKRERREWEGESERERVD